jgi:hypothetical protein
VFAEELFFVFLNVFSGFGSAFWNVPFVVRCMVCVGVRDTGSDFPALHFFTFALS